MDFLEESQEGGCPDVGTRSAFAPGVRGGFNGVHGVDEEARA